MIVDSFTFDSENEKVLLNIFIEPLQIEEKTVYVVGLINPDETIPSQEQLREIALNAETVSPFEHSVTLDELSAYIQESVRSGTWATSFLISEHSLEIDAPASAYDEGLADATRGLHCSANPHVSGTKEADDWEEGWLEGQRGNFEDFNN